MADMGVAVPVSEPAAEQTRGERLVEAQVRACLAPGGPAAAGADGALVFANVGWIAPTRDGGPMRDGEIDVLVVHPEHGILAIEVKDGPVSLDGHGRWYAGTRHLDETPFQQAAKGKFAIGAVIQRHPGWRQAAPPRLIHAVAFVDTERASLLRSGRTDLGADAPLDLVIDKADLADEASTARALERVFAHWAGDGARNRRLEADELAIIADAIAPTVRLRPLLRSELDEGEHELLIPTHHQLTLLTTLRNVRRASIVGAAGSGKTLLALEKARQLATNGFNVLLVCFNAPLAAALARDSGAAPLVASGRLTVSTFHELCTRLAREAGTLPPVPSKLERPWFEVVLPQALARAVDTVGGRWQALVIDEGQDLAEDWLTTLALLLSEPDDDVLYLFHDPAQALFRPDVTASLGLQEFPLVDNCRNARPIHELAFRWYTGGLESEPLREDGRAPEVIPALPGEASLDALRDVLNRLVKDEGVARDRIAVLTGVSMAKSAAWNRRRFKGDNTLWNGNVTDAGVSRGLAFDALPPQPPNTILCQTIHRFKGLERDVVILIELREDDPRLETLLYIGASRAKHHLVIIAPPSIAARLTPVAG